MNDNDEHQLRGVIHRLTDHCRKLAGEKAAVLRRAGDAEALAAQLKMKSVASSCRIFALEQQVEELAKSRVAQTSREVKLLQATLRESRNQVDFFRAGKVEAENRLRRIRVELP